MYFDWKFIWQSYANLKDYKYVMSARCHSQLFGRIRLI